MPITTRRPAVTACAVMVAAFAVGYAQQDAPVYKPAELDVKPKILEKRLPVDGAPPGLFASPFVVDFVIEPDGTFHNARVLHPPTGPHPFAGEYLTLLRQWRFAPGQKGGLPVRVAVQLRVEADSRAGKPRKLGKPMSGGLQLTIPPMTTAWTIDGVIDDFGAGAIRMLSSAAAGVAWPRVVKEVKPVYSPEAMRARAEGIVEVEILVGIRGEVTAARIIRSDAQHLDAGALKAATQWRFEPAMSDGRPIPVIVSLCLEFRLHG